MEKNKTVKVNGQDIPVKMFDGKSYKLYKGERYFSRGAKRLHIVVWKYYNGEIPSGHDIHHKNENPFNNDISNLEVIEIILKQLNKPKSLIKHVTDRPGHDRRYAIDAAKIMTELQWKQSVTFEEGIKKTINWYLQNTKWLGNVVSGDYQKYYESMYSNR